MRQFLQLSALVCASFKYFLMSSQTSRASPLTNADLQVESDLQVVRQDRGHLIIPTYELLRSPDLVAGNCGLNPALVLYELVLPREVFQLRTSHVERKFLDTLQIDQFVVFSTACSVAVTCPAALSFARATSADSTQIALQQWRTSRRRNMAHCNLPSTSARSTSFRLCFFSVTEIIADVSHLSRD